MSLAQEYYHAVECQLATLETLLSRSRSYQSDMDRQYKICFDMLLVCVDIDEEVEDRHSRTKELLSAPSPLRALREWALEACIPKHSEYIASLPYGGYNNQP